MNPADQIVLRLAQMDPIVTFGGMYDPEGTSDECVFCETLVRDGGCPIHASDCLWVEACRYTGTDLGAHGVAE